MLPKTIPHLEVTTPTHVPATAPGPDPGTALAAYHPPRLEDLGCLQQLIRGATAKGVDMTGRTMIEEY